MDHQEKLTATVSPDGQIALPSGVSERQNWSAGTRLVVEETPDGVNLKRAGEQVFPPTNPADVFGMLKYKGKPKTLTEMDEGVVKEARRSFLKSVDPDA